MPKIAIRTVAVILVGPPGSGKGTVSQHLTGCFDLPHISTGDILREHVHVGDEIGREVKALMDSGSLVPDELVNRVVRQRIGRADCEQGFILDGYPRTLAQGKVLSALLAERGLAPLVIHLDVDYNKIVTRLTARRSCPQCGMVYNVLSKPPKEAGLCDQDDCPVIVRDDDREDVISQRLAAYDRQSQPLVDYYAKTVEQFFVVNGNDGSPEDIADRACRLISAG